MAFQFRCTNELRRALVRDTRDGGGFPVVNGLDALEVDAADQRRLRVRFIHPLAGPDAVPGTPALSRQQFAIDGGVRVTGIRVVAVAAGGDSRELVLDASAAGDFSTYRLRLVAGPGSDAPPDRFDPALAEIAFSFKIDCPSEFDCRDEAVCPPAPVAPPRLDYLAKDYASFRRLLLDRLALIMPAWRERSAADVGVTLVELLAYAADRLSYFQDAVATEAYLGTARRRPSLRRHARLLDYRVNDGVNARAWVAVTVQGSLTLPAGTQVLTRLPGGAPARIDPDSDAHRDALAADVEVFETLHDATMHTGLERIELYTWGNVECCLPRGATRATLAGDLPLEPGDVLVLEEVASPATGLAADADPTRRQAVRLEEVRHGEDVLAAHLADPPAPVPVTDVAWRAEDALAFPLCLSARIGNQMVTGMAVARGNVVLADHGRTVADAPLVPDRVPDAGPYRPRLPRGTVTRRVPYDHAAALGRPAAEVIAQDPRAALPAVLLRAGTETWAPAGDLLASDRFAQEFVVETEGGDAASLRFGDGVLGRRPGAGTRFALTVRQGGGPAGNVGSEALRHVVTSEAVVAARNPLPAADGQDPETLEEIRLSAPVAFRTQARAVTEADYQAMAERHPQVQKAMATRRWTGSWYTMFVTVDRRGGAAVDLDFEDELRAFLEPVRLAGHDLEIDGPRFVPLDVALRVCVRPSYVRADVKDALLEAFAATDLPRGGRGFFHPDNVTFGQPVHLSAVIAAAMAVPGVAWVEPVRFQRWGKPARGEIADGRIAFDRLEIARLDNDPNAPEHGKLELVMEGGL